jgi:hypothetical protein
MVKPIAASVRAATLAMVSHRGRRRREGKKAPLRIARLSVKSAHLCMKTRDKVPKRHDVEGAE